MIDPFDAESNSRSNIKRVSEYIDALREEIVNAQKDRSALFRWKITVIGGIASIGLGVNLMFVRHQQAIPDQINSVLLLCLIPFLCNYVDALCYHLNIRILVIGQFLRDNIHGMDSVGVMMQKYEQACGRIRYVFNIENYALDVVTILACVGVFIYSFAVGSYYKTALMFSALAGLFLMAYIRVIYTMREISIEEDSICAKLNQEDTDKKNKVKRLEELADKKIFTRLVFAMVILISAAGIFYASVYNDHL